VSIRTHTPNKNANNSDDSGASSAILRKEARAESGCVVLPELRVLRKESLKRW
jgi:hypothetical protein